MELNAKTMPFLALKVQAELDKGRQPRVGSTLEDFLAAANRAGLLRMPNETLTREVTNRLLAIVPPAEPGKHLEALAKGSETAFYQGHRQGWYQFRDAMLEALRPLMHEPPLEVLNVVLVSKYTPEMGLSEEPGVLLRRHGLGWSYGSIEDGRTYFSTAEYIRRATPEEFAKIKGHHADAIQDARDSVVTETERLRSGEGRQ